MYFEVPDFSTEITEIKLTPKITCYTCTCTRNSSDLLAVLKAVNTSTYSSWPEKSNLMNKVALRSSAQTSNECV